MADCFIYGLVDPRSNCLRYIGKTTNLRHRFWRHTHPSSKDRTHRACWIRGIVAVGLLPRIEVITVVDRAVEDAEERYYIALFRAMGADLVNLSDGGGGGGDALKGRKLTAAHKAKISASHIGIRPDAATRAKMSAQRKGRRLSAEARAKIGAASKGKKRSPETVARVQAALMGHYVSDASREKMSLTAKRRWQDPALVEQARVRGRAMWKDPVLAEKLRQARPRGVASPQAKLDDAKVREIRIALAAGESLGSIGRRYGVAAAPIQSIRDGRTWKHVV
jgi:hypothetical protein